MVSEFKGYCKFYLFFFSFPLSHCSEANNSPGSSSPSENQVSLLIDTALHLKAGVCQQGDGGGSKFHDLLSEL